MDALAALLAASWWFPYAVLAAVVIDGAIGLVVISCMWRRTKLMVDIRDDVRAIRRAGLPINAVDDTEAPPFSRAR